MSSRLRIRLVLAVAACVVAAGLVSALIQREAARADFREFERVTELRTALLELDDAFDRATRTRSQADVSAFHAAQRRYDRIELGAIAADEEAGEKTLLAREQTLARAWSDSAEGEISALRPDDAREPAARGAQERAALLRDFLAVNRTYAYELAAERERRQRTATLLPVLLVAILTSAFALVLWLGVERPARAGRRRQAQQGELGDALQVARTESEAYSMLARHIMRSSDAAHVTILNRNNSADRLEAVTPVRQGSAVEAGLDGAAPDSCLAIRLARPHRARPGDTALLSCDLCGKSAENTTCVPSLVGGEVIGSVLVEHERPLPEATGVQLAGSVAESAPVVANLRNLAIAELRAATDGLTGLPNQRAVHDTLKRMVAQAGRTVEPLAVILFDLDRFKQINDTYGHGRGDDVLAAVGDAAGEAVRASDFVGRLGGEEFAVLLPGTGRDGALTVAENLREAIGALEVSGVDREITSSFGVAVLPDDAPDAQTLLRVADRALYQAKANGRDRVETVAV
jgi:diguanylate cyclase (GGDEF)-like protein